MDFPIFILAKDCGEVLRFSSIEEMQHQLEAIDVENCEYTAWDRNGIFLRLSVQKPVWLRIEPGPRTSQHGQLKDALAQYAAALGIEVTSEVENQADYDGAFAKIKMYLDGQGASKGRLQRILKEGLCRRKSKNNP